MDSGHQPATSLRAASPRPAKPKLIFGTAGSKRDGLLKEIGGPLIIAQHEIILAAQQVSGAIGRGIFLQNTERTLVLSALIKSAGPAHNIRRRSGRTCHARNDKNQESNPQ